MLRIFGDFESYYDRAYSLRKMSVIEYILDAQWETLGCAVAIEHEDPFLLPQNEIAPFLRDIKQPYCFISHNATFDAAVLAYRYNIHPDALLCTMSMARALLVHEIPNGRISLANVLLHLGLGEKGKFIANMIGVRWRDLVANPGKMMEFTGYAINDVVGCRNIFFRLREQLPAREAYVMDRLIRMVTQPVLRLNESGLVQYRDIVRARKSTLLSRVTLTDPGALASNPKFAKLLEELGVEPPMKISPSDPDGKKETYAFAKTDAAFAALLEHDNPAVQALVAARLGIKTTIEETRSTRFLDIGEATRHSFGFSLLPVPLKYSGAHTHRYSGDWQLNMQNLSNRKSREIRRCIYAPPRHKIVAVDAAQVEARLVAWLCGQLDLIAMFRDGQDTYKAFASEIFRIDLALVSKVMRFVGKTCILGLGFSMGSNKLFWSIKTLAREQGIDLGFELTLQDCIQYVNTYRHKFNNINGSWNDLGHLLMLMARGQADGYEFGPCRIEGTTVILPSGLKLFYDNLRWDAESGNYVFDQAQFTKKIYGGKFLENIVQALDRQHVVEAGLRAEHRARLAGVPDPRVLLNIHDENVHCVPDEWVDTMAQICYEEMNRNVGWSAGLPLASEVKVGVNLADMREWHPAGS